MTKREDITIELWPGDPPNMGSKMKTEKGDNLITDRGPIGGQAHEHVMTRIGKPMMRAFLPETPNGAAMLILPGGGYGGEWYDKEGYEVARYFNASGITGFVLHYRLPSEGWTDGRNVPLQDCQRAIRILRARAAEFGLDAKKIGIMGFSAGGHAAASLATRFDEHVYEPVDATDKFETRPDFAALLYPVITLNVGTHVGSYNLLLGPNAPAELIDAYSCEKRVTAQTPPTFIAHAADDGTVPFFENAIAMIAALRKAGVPSELHGYEKGGHGFGLRMPQTMPVSHWPEQFIAWAKAHRFV